MSLTIALQALDTIQGRCGGPDERPRCKGRRQHLLTRSREECSLQNSHPNANEELITERHRALNWLIRYMGQSWDNVTTDT
ncbi:MAG: DUF4272 domain-containing protein [Kofleriaceae bacterium]